MVCNKECTELYINKTGKIFIKASAEADGVLYFDEPRLVACKKLLYTSGNNKAVPLYTSGLNLTQLGYLDASSDDSDKIDEATREALHKAYINKASSAIANAIQTTHNDITIDYNTLVKLVSKVQMVVNAEKMLKEELDTIKALDVDRYNTLVDQYKSINETLTKEIALLEALKNNTKADELESKLAELLNSFSSVETSQQQILEELAALKTTATAAVEKISSTRLLADYEELAKKIDLSESFTEIQTLAIENIENSYQEQLTVLVNHLESIVNADERSSLIAVLTKLRATELTDVQATLISLVSKLNYTIEQDTVNSTLSEMADAAGSADYVRLYSLISVLEGLLNARGLTAVAAELTQLTANVSDEVAGQLSDLVKELKELIKVVNSTEPGTLSAQVNALSTAVKAEVDNGTDTVKENITEAVDSLRIAFTADFKAKLNSIAAGLEGCVSNINKDTPIKGLITTLNAMYDSATDGSQVKKAVEAIQELITTRSNALSEMSKVNYKTWYSSPVESFVQSAITEIWQTNMSERLAKLLTEIETLFTDTISKGLSAFDNGYTSITTLLDNTKNTYATEALLNSISAAAFIQLFSKIKSVLSTYDQNIENRNIVHILSSLVQSPDELNNAVANINNNYIISTIITDWQNADDVVKKQQLQLTLKDELIKVIDTDSKLFSVIAELLCPNITTLESTIDGADEFYTSLITALGSIKSAVLDKSSIADIAIANNEPYLALLESTDFKTYLQTDFDKPAMTWLPDDFVSSVDELKEKLMVILSDADILKSFNLGTATNSSTVDEMLKLVENTSLIELLESLKEDLIELENTATIEPGYEDIFFWNFSHTI